MIEKNVIFRRFYQYRIGCMRNQFFRYGMSIQRIRQYKFYYFYFCFRCFKWQKMSIT